MKVKQVNRELLKAIKSPSANVEELITKVNNQEQQEQTINKLEGKIDLDPSIIKEAN